MGSLLSPSQECHPFTPASLAHDLVVSSMLRVIIKIQGDHIGAQTNYQSTVSLDPFKQDGSRQEISVSVRKSLYGITTPIHGIGIP